MCVGYMWCLSSINNTTTTYPQAHIVNICDLRAAIASFEHIGIHAATLHSQKDGLEILLRVVFLWVENMYVTKNHVLYAGTLA